jgi:hypothetical protein
MRKLLFISMVLATGLVIGEATSQAQPTTVTFTTPGAHTWTVFAGATRVTFDVYGADGGGNHLRQFRAPGSARFEWSFILSRDVLADVGSSTSSTCEWSSRDSLAIRSRMHQDGHRVPGGRAARLPW